MPPVGSASVCWLRSIRVVLVEIEPEVKYIQLFPLESVPSHLALWVLGKGDCQLLFEGKVIDLTLAEALQRATVHTKV